MISDAIKSRFISSVLTKTADEIRTKQGRIVLDWNLVKTGQLYRSMKGHFDVTAGDGSGKLTMGYLNYARFLDMRKNKGYHLYNKTVFGMLYGRMVPKLRYGLTQDVQRAIAQSITESFRQGPYTVK